MMSILERDPHAPQSWFGNLPVTSRYTAGLAGERFFRALKDEGLILGSHCEACDVTYVPARQFCERCMDELDDWHDVGKIGELHTFTLLYVNRDGSPREDPEIIAFVRMADGGIIHRIVEIEPERIEIGIQVEAVLKPKSKRVGSILDILHFKPV